MEKFTSEKYLHRITEFDDKPLLKYLTTKYTNIKGDRFNTKLRIIINILFQNKIYTKEELFDWGSEDLSKIRGMSATRINLLYTLMGEKEPFF